MKREELKILRERIKTFRKAIEDHINNNVDGVSVYGYKQKMCAAAMISFNSDHASGLSYSMGVDHTLSEALRSVIWFETGSRVCKSLEAAGYEIDYQPYATKIDYRTFIIKWKD